MKNIEKFLWPYDPSLRWLAIYPFVFCFFGLYHYQVTRNNGIVGFLLGIYFVSLLMVKTEGKGLVPPFLLLLQKHKVMTVVFGLICIVGGLADLS